MGEYADRLYTQALTDPRVDSLDKQDMARAIRAGADELCLDWKAVLDQVNTLHPHTLDFRKASVEVETETFM
jgi:hypothetical protein